MASIRIVLVLLAAALAPRAEAVTLYKSIGPNGVVQFSDVPPDEHSKLVEQRNLNAPQGPSISIESASGRATPIEALIGDDAVARATAQVDLAEHALALARRGLWSPTEGLSLKGPIRTASDEERIEHYKRNVLLARQTLLEVMKQRAAALGSQATFVASR